MSKKQDASGVSEIGGVRGAKGLKKYMHSTDTRLDQTHSTDEDIRVHGTERETTEKKERKRSFWSKKKYLILAISLISLLLIALTLVVSLYYGLYYGNNVSKGKCKVSKEKKSFIVFFQRVLI